MKKPTKRKARGIPFRKGAIPGPGRPKGSLNKTTREAKIAIALCFEQIGGIEALVTWAKKNRALFYTKIYPRLLPLQVAGAVDATVKVQDDTARAALERLLIGIVAQRRERENEEASAQAADARPVPTLTLIPK